MPTPPDRGQPHEGPPIEPIRVLRPRRTDALAELIREYRESSGHYEPVALPKPPRGAEAQTQELPPVFDDERPAARGDRSGRGPGPRRATVVAAVAAAGLVGFGCAFLLPGDSDERAAPAPGPAATAPAAPTPTASGATDPDGPGTLREGATGPEVTDLQQRLLRIPNVYDNGATSGRYDADLTAAVARFQLWYGIRGDENGVYGNDTRLDLESRTGGG
ncbi:peptidoglycan-binding domain-containing protein [Streptomyces sp. NPDC050619]|uniref:peptidoglycan-binding domain-containing protein n=1 Tax=Streptomyces sp. NPDC050619 TaxID=3157214 RepID=UPI00342BCD26